MRSKFSHMVDLSFSTTIFCVSLFLTFAAVAVSLPQGAPGRVSLAGKGAHVQVADGQPYDRGLVQLAGDGPGQRQHLGQLKELEIFLPPPRSGRIARLLFT